MKILSKNKFEQFDGFIYNGVKPVFMLKISNGREIKCTNDHKFMMTGNILKELKDIKIGDEFSTGLFVSDIINLEYQEDVYDALNVANGNVFLVNGVIVSNCNMLYIDECITKSSIITIKENNNEYEIEIGQFFDRHFNENGELDGTDIIPLFDYEILTVDGYKDFKSVKRTITNKTIKLTLSNNEFFEGTPDHILIVSGKYIALKDFKVNDYITDELYITEIVENNSEQYVYDIMDVADNNSYLVKSQNNYINSKNCAFIQNWTDFSASVLPVLSSGKSTKLIFTSTPKGLNHFYDYYEGAKKKTNGFKLIEVKWNDVPGRDEKWKEEILGTLNHDLERFEQEYCVAGDTEIEIKDENNNIILKKIKDVYNDYDF